MNGERASMVWPTLGSRMAKEQNDVVAHGMLSICYDVLNTC